MSSRLILVAGRCRSRHLMRPRLPLIRLRLWVRPDLCLLSSLGHNLLGLLVRDAGGGLGLLLPWNLLVIGLGLPLRLHLLIALLCLSR